MLSWLSWSSVNLSDWSGLRLTIRLHTWDPLAQDNIYIYVHEGGVPILVHKLTSPCHPHRITLNWQTIGILTHWNDTNHWYNPQKCLTDKIKQPPQVCYISWHCCNTATNSIYNRVLYTIVICATTTIYTLRFPVQAVLLCLIIYCGMTCLEAYKYGTILPAFYKALYTHIFANPISCQTLLFEVVKLLLMCTWWM